MNITTLEKLAKEYYNECQGGEADYFDEEHFVEFLAKKLPDDMHCAHLIEYRDNGYDYPTTAYKCSNCGEIDLYECDLYCSTCGAKFSEPIEKIPESDCRLCSYSYNGLKDGCTLDMCYMKRKEEREYEYYLQLKKRFERKDNNG